MVTVNCTIQVDEGEEALAVVQDYILQVVDRLREFEERYKNKQLPLPAEFVETKKIAGRVVKVKYTIERDNAKA
jgi:hypothetical protein